MKVLTTFKPTQEDWDLIHRTWPDQITPIEADAQGEVGDDDAKDLLAIVGSMRGAHIDLVRRSPNLKVIHTLGHGIDALATPEWRDLILSRGIVVARANPASIPIAEYVLMSMIALSRRLIRIQDALLSHGDWSVDLKVQRSTGVLGGELYGKNLGLVGYGNIGREIEARARAFGMRVGALVRRSPDPDTSLDFFALSPEDFLSQCDYVVLCAPLTDETRGLIDARRISMMRDGAYLINISRGPIIDEGAVHAALVSGKLAGVGLDVWDREEIPGPLEGYPSPYRFDGLNVVATPHYCGATQESRGRAIAAVGANLRHLLNGEPLENTADFQRSY